MSSMRFVSFLGGRPTDERDLSIGRTVGDHVQSPAREERQSGPTTVGGEGEKAVEEALDDRSAEQARGKEVSEERTG